MVPDLVGVPSPGVKFQRYVPLPPPNESLKLPFQELAFWLTFVGDIPIVVG